VFVCLWVSSGITAVLPSRTSSLGTSIISAKELRTTDPGHPFGDDVRKRHTTPGYIYPSLSCMGTLLPNGQVYQYCSTLAAASQLVFTTALPSGWTHCPDYTLCCGIGTPDVEVGLNLFVSDGYTVTGYVCYPTPLLAALNSPATNVLWPPAFSRSLVSLGNTPQSVTSVPNAVPHSVSNNNVIPGSTTTSKTTPSNSNPQTTDQTTLQTTPVISPRSFPQSSAPPGGSGGTSTSNNIGLGIGIGIGLPATLAGIAMCWMQYQKRHER